MMTAHGTYIDCLDKGIDLATAANDTAQAESWAVKVAKARIEFDLLWWNTTTGCFAQTCSCQTAQAVSVVLNISNSKSKQSTAALLKSVDAWNTSFVAGIIGVRAMF